MIYISNYTRLPPGINWPAIGVK